MKLKALLLGMLVLIAMPAPAYAWGGSGHQTVGAIADARLHAHARAHVRALLGKLTLHDAGPWLDCAKDVSSATGPYQPMATYKATCGIFSTKAAKQEFERYAHANWSNCELGPQSGRNCHSAYHFTDIFIGHPAYSDTLHGAEPYDLIHAINAAIAKLQGRPVPAPFVIPTKRIALLMLAHLVGDLHQPLHVGSAYLSIDGAEIDPDNDTYDPATFTQGGNLLFDGTRKLHGEWDDIGTLPGTAALADEAKLLPATPGTLGGFAQTWANDTLGEASNAFAGLSFSEPNASANHWTISFADRTAYMQTLRATQHRQIVKAGAHLAELLNAIWP